MRSPLGITEEETYEALRRLGPSWRRGIVDEVMKDHPDTDIEKATILIGIHLGKMTKSGILIHAYHKHYRLSDHSASYRCATARATIRDAVAQCKDAGLSRGEIRRIVSEAMAE